VPVTMNGFEYNEFEWLRHADYDLLHSILATPAPGNPVNTSALRQAGAYLDADSRPLRARSLLLSAELLDAGAMREQWGARPLALAHRVWHTPWAIIRYWPWSALVFAGFVVLIGWLIYVTDPAPPDQKRQSALRRFWFSLDATIPLVTLDEAHKKISMEGWRHHWLLAQKLLGTVAFLVMGATVAILIY